MAKQTLSFICQNCGALYPRWSGKCDSCDEWNTLVAQEQMVPLSGAKGASLPKGRASKLVGLKSETPLEKRIETGFGELDRVVGGGFVPASAILIGGDPGIGKSTLLLQASAKLALDGYRVIYVSGEEAAAQISLRARRLGLEDAPILLATETNVSDIIATLSEEQAPALAVIDSIQTIWSPVIDAAPGTVSQLKAGSEALVRFAKKKGTCILLVGHVTKDGQIAGPRVIEHLVDTVLYFEGDRGHQFRILRAVKNRFGPTDEIGVFEMSDSGLVQVTNPSRLFMSSDENLSPGTAVFAGIEGTRPLLMEIQALVSPAPFGTPRRTVVGSDSNRLAMILAVLEARGGLSIGAQDVYLNIAGGFKMREPAADMAVACALISSFTGTILPPNTIFFGEIALSGAIRPVSQTEARLREATKLGLNKAICPKGAETYQNQSMQITTLETITDLIAWVATQEREDKQTPHRSPKIVNP